MLAKLFVVGSVARLLQLTHVTSGPGWLPSGMKPPLDQWHWAELWPGQVARGVAGYKVTPKKEQLPVGCSPPQLRAIRLPSLSSVPGDAPAPSPMRGPGCSPGMAGSGCRDVLQQQGPAVGMCSDSGAQLQAEGQRG